MWQHYPSADSLTHCFFSLVLDDGGVDTSGLLQGQIIAFPHVGDQRSACFASGPASLDRANTWWRLLSRAKKPAFDLTKLFRAFHVERGLASGLNRKSNPLVLTPTLSLVLKLTQVLHLALRAPLLEEDCRGGSKSAANARNFAARLRGWMREAGEVRRWLLFEGLARAEEEERRAEGERERLRAAAGLGPPLRLN